MACAVAKRIECAVCRRFESSDCLSLEPNCWHAWYSHETMHNRCSICFADPLRGKSRGIAFCDNSFMCLHSVFGPALFVTLVSFCETVFVPSVKYFCLHQQAGWWRLRLRNRGLLLGFSFVRRLQFLLPSGHLLHLACFPIKLD